MAGYWLILAVAGWAAAVDSAETKQGGNDTMAGLVERLFHPARYKRYVRPGTDEGRPITVYVDMFINSISSINEQSMDYTMTLYLRQRWKDERLAFTEFPDRDYVPLNYDLFDRLWVPDLNIKNQKDGHFRDITVPNRLLYLYHDGMIYYSQGLVLKLECMMNLEKFPMDNQSCQLRFGSYGYTTNDIIVEWRNISEPVQVSEDLLLPEFDYQSSGYGDCTSHFITGTFSCRYAVLHFTRKFNYYLIQTFVPSMLIVILSWVSFWIDIEAVPARVTLGLLTVLTMTTQSSGVIQRLPRVSYIKAIDVWMTACLVFVFGALVEYCIVNVLARRDKERREAREERQKMMQLQPFMLANAISHMAESALQQRNGARKPGDSGAVGTGKDGPADLLGRLSATGGTTGGTTGITGTTATMHSGKRKPWWVEVRESSALLVEIFSRIFFPAMFLLFNLFYWVYYLFMS